MFIYSIRNKVTNSVSKNNTDTNGSINTATKPYGNDVFVKNGITTEPSFKARFLSSSKDVQNILKAMHAQYDQIIKQNPGNPGPFVDRAQVYNRYGEHDFAAEDYTRAIKLDPKEPILYTVRAMSKKALGDVKGAIEDYTKAIELEPHPGRYLNRGALYLENGKKTEAIQDWEKSISLDPNFMNGAASRNIARAKQPW